MGIRPSDLYCVAKYPGDPVAFWFDRAVINFGSAVKQDLERVAKKEKNERASERASHLRLMKWLDFDGKLTKQRFAAPPITKTR